MEIIIVRPFESVTLESDSIVHKISNSYSKNTAISKLKKISILTNDMGPIIDDVALALFFDTFVLVIPSQHETMMLYMTKLQSYILSIIKK